MKFHSLFVLLSYFPNIAFSKRPHIIFIVADDLGWNDVSFHGSKQIPTPNIDALAQDGIILNNYYVQPICTPSRSALMTGVHPIHTGMQHGVIVGPTPYGLPLNFKIMPEYLKQLGYRTHIVGKWHLGFFKKEYTPLHRGFETHFGYWCGHQDYYDHTAEEWIFWGYDMRKNMSIAWDAFGKYSTELFTKHATDLIEKHNPREPLFLYLPHLAVHSANSYTPLQAPEKYTSRFPWITNKNRRTFAGMVSALDDGVGEVVKALFEKEMLNNSIIVFTTDNGGPAAGFDMNYASNWPLRGVKSTLWEGGIRGVGFIWSTLLKKSGRVSTQLMKIEDWLPTIYSAIGGNSSNLQAMDGIDMWKTLSENRPSPQNEILHNIDILSNTSAIRSGNYKLVQGTAHSDKWNGWYGPSGRRTLNIWKHLVRNSIARKSLRKVRGSSWKFNENFKRAVKCGKKPKKQNCNAQIAPCLFNIAEDPCEYHNLAKKYPKIVQGLLEKIKQYNKTAVPPGNKPIDKSSNPMYHGAAWVPWLSKA